MTMLLRKFGSLFAFLVYLWILVLDVTTAFAPALSSRIQQKRITQHDVLTTTTTQLQLSTNQQFDISKPTFDLYSLRQVRGDALTKYNSLNQSEPLRINLSLFVTLSLLASPILAPEVNNGIALTIPQLVLAYLGAAGSASFFWQNIQARSRQLTRLEKELDALSLPIRLPTNQLADAAFQQAKPVMQTIKTENCRILALSGTADELKVSLGELQVLGRRLEQANTFVVAVPTDGSTIRDWGIDSQRMAWLAQVDNIDLWKNYFSSLTNVENDATAQNKTFRWFGLTTSGRSFGSGTESPSWMQVLGKSLSPIDVLDEKDGRRVASSEEEEFLLEAQQRFYDALTNGRLDDMQDVFADSHDPSVSSVIAQQGRLDPWSDCLQEDARPAGMKISGCDFFLLDDNTAYTTCVEFPQFDATATLLAVQMWKKHNDVWKLQKHQTIPWTPEVPAAGTLICDCRGCVSLVRTRDRRTYGGLLG